MMILRRLALGLSVWTSSVVLLAACSPAPAPASQNPRDPSSPTAPEGVTPATPQAAASGSPSTQDHSAHAGHAPASPAPPSHAGHGAATAGADAGVQAEVYVCPMHPEVTSPGPGVCPKCNMKLVKKK